MQRQIRQVAMIVESQLAPRRRMFTGIARYMHEHVPWAIYLKPFGVEKSLERWLRDWRGDGVIAAVTDTETSLLTGLGIPVVDVVGISRTPGVPLVHTNDRSVGRVGANHLRDCGFKHFGFIEYHDYAWSTGRRAGFVELLNEHGLSCDVYPMAYPNIGSGGPEAWEAQQKGMRDWIARLPKPAGVMCSTDLLAQQFLEACLRSGIAVPEQIAVIGADNDEPICRVCFPPLSSVIINDDQRGYMAASVLDKMMSGEKAPTETVWVEPVGVMSRASTDILAVDDEAVAAALRYIRDYSCDDIGVDDVVKRVPVSRSVLERRFRKVVGRSLNNEILRVRLNKAVQLLCETDLELKVIAMKSGFGSTSYMSSVFRERLDRTPGSYRGGRGRTGGRDDSGQVPVKAGQSM